MPKSHGAERLIGPDTIHTMFCYDHTLESSELGDFFVDLPRPPDNLPTT